MTTVTGFDIIGCPTCGRHYRTTVYGSMYISAWKEWSDGRCGSTLFTPRPDLRRCVCGALFLLSERTTIAEMTYLYPSQRPRLPISWRTVVSRLMGRRPLRLLGAEYRTELFEGEPWEEYPEPPDFAPELDSDALAGAASNITAGTPRTIEIALRRELWRSLNDPFRRPDAGGTAVGCTAPAHSAFVPNLERLVELLGAADEPDWLSIGEILRELGRFEQAQECLAKVRGERSRVAQQLRDLARDGDVRVALIAGKRTGAVRSPTATG